MTKPLCHVAIVIPDRPIEKLVSALTEQLPGITLQVWPNIHSPELVEFAIAWLPPKDAFANMPNLRVVQSYGAGVDNVLPACPEQVAVSRIVDPDLAQAMADYVTAVILSDLTRLSLFAAQQQQCLWKPKTAKKGRNVLILGAGQLGAQIGERLASNDLSVFIWSQSPKQFSFAEHGTGEQQLTEFLMISDYVVNLLPLTQATTQLLNAQFFARCKPGAVLVNVARGQHLDEHAMLAALENGQLSQAYLDVFSSEPLPATHPFWRHSQITVTPHSAALTNINTAIAQIVENINLCSRFVPVLHQIDRKKGY